MTREVFMIYNQDEAFEKIEQDFPDLVEKFHAVLAHESANYDEDIPVTTFLTNQEMVLTENHQAYGRGYSFGVMEQKGASFDLLFGIFIEEHTQKLYLVRNQAPLITH